jgi:C4-dicarboxylate-specific signal transduction histidine kinase
VFRVFGIVALGQPNDDAKRSHARRCKCVVWQHEVECAWQVPLVNTGREEKSAPGSDYLKISAGRDRLVDNRSFDALKNVVRQSIDYYATRRLIMKERKAGAEVRKKGSAVDSAVNLKTYVERVASRLPDEIVEELQERAQAAEESIRASDELAKQQRVMLATLATAGMAALAIDHELRKELGRLRALIEKSESRFSEQADLADLLAKLKEWAKATEESWKIFSPLMTEESRQDRERYRLKDIIDSSVRYSRRFLEGISVRRSEIAEDILLPRATASSWHAIFQNIFINAVNAQLDSDAPIIQCTTAQTGRSVWLYVQDRGVGLGVPLKESAVLFEPFERRLQLSADRKGLGLGGAGLGLTIVRMLAESVACKVYFTEPDDGYSTAFCMEWRQNVRSS